MRPRIHTVERNINRKISNDGNSFIINIFTKFVPLAEEQILDHFPENKFLFMLLHSRLQSLQMPGTGYADLTAAAVPVGFGNVQISVGKLDDTGNGNAVVSAEIT